MKLAPEFLNSITATGEKTLSWAQAVSEELVREMHVVSVSKKSEDLKMRIGQFVTELREKKKELGDMEHRIRRVYDQIQPSPGYGGISHIQISEEKFRALGILSAFTRNLESILLGWESILYAVEKRHVSFEEAYAANSSKLTAHITTTFTGKGTTSVESIGHRQDSQDSLGQANNIKPIKPTPQIDLETKGKRLSSNPVNPEKVILTNTSLLGISRGQWAIITALGLGVVILYCVLCLLVFRILMS